MASEAPIVSRFLRLRKQVLEPCDSAVTFEGLIDALLVLYEEVGRQEKEGRRQVVTTEFLAQWQAVVHQYGRLRANIGDFQVIRVIGRGNFADVKLAKEKSSGKVYALKVMKKAGENTSAFFCEERDIMARNTSPWLTKLDYAFQDTSALYLAMEFHCGGDLLTLLDKHDNHLEEDSVRFYTAEVALGIHDLHNMGFVHRDIKPENILIDRTGHVKLADFGNAARLSSSGTVNKVMPVGTPDYIAPEVLKCLQSGSESHGVECDYWSLGILAYEMFYGNSPFTDMDGSVINTYSNIMSHGDKVTFPVGPGGQKASVDLRNLIEGLLLPSNKRLGHPQLVRHCFFSSLVWSNMANTTPPTVPEVSGPDDDCNFDQIEESVSGPDISSLKKGTEFQNLPFVGFTFTSSKVTGSSSLDKGLGEVSSLEKDLKGKVEQLEKIKLKNFQLEQQALNHTRVVDTSVREFEQVEKLTAQLNLAEQDNAQLKSTIKNVERILEIERQDRSATEQKTISLLQDVRNKWARAEEERMESMKEELGKQKESAEEFESRYRESQSDLKKYKGELESVIGVKNQLKTNLKDYKQRLENVASLDEQRSKTIARLETEVTSYKSELEQARSKMDESRSLDGKVDTLQLLIEQRDQILAEKDAEIRIKATELESFSNKQKETKKTVQELEEKLSAEGKKCANLHSELEAAKNDTLVETDSQLGVQAQLKSEIKEILAENAELKSKAKKLDKEIVSARQREHQMSEENEKISKDVVKMKKGFENEVKEKEDFYKEKIKNLEIVFETRQMKTEEVKKQQKNELNDSTSKRVLELESKLQGNEMEITKLNQEKVNFTRQNERLQKELEDKQKEQDLLKADLATNLERTRCEQQSEANDAAELKDENDKLRTELKEVKLDLRIEKRELEKKTTLVTYIREREAKNKDKIEEFEKDKLELENEITDLKKVIANHGDLSQELEKQEGKNESLSKEFKKMKDEKSEMALEIRKLKTDASTVDSERESFKKKISSLVEAQESMASLKVNNAALIEVSAELEKQVIDFERINEKLEAKVEKTKTEKRELDSCIDKEKEETRKAKILVNEQKSTKILLESKIKELQQRLDEADQERTDEKEATEKHLSEYKVLCKKLSDTLEDLTKDNVSKEQFGIMNERAKNNLELDNKQLKEELSAKITQLNSLKESNFKLTHGIEEAIKKIGDKNEQMDNLQHSMEAEKRVVEEKITRHEATLAQQTKLIDFLQSKVASLEGRKKTFADKIFGSTNKENRPGSANSVTGGVPVAYADLESLLEKEKTRNKKMTNQLSRARAEVVALKTTTIAAACVDSLDLVDAQKTGQAGHNIPHRLSQAPCKKTTRCPVCQENVSFMTPSSVCRDCGLTVHSPCAPSLPPTCGLSSQLLAALGKQGEVGGSSITQRPLPPAPGGPRRLSEGPVQTLVGGQWTEAHLVLLDTGMLDMYQDKEASSRLDQVGLTLPHCRVSVQSSVSYKEVHFVSSSDRPYTFKLTVHSRGKPEKVVYLMCQNFSAKVDWVNRLEEVIKSSPTNLTVLEESEEVSRSLICSLPPPQEVLAVCQVDQVLLLGTSQGLAVTSPWQGVKHLEGVDTPVHQIFHLQTLNLVVLATGGDNLPSQLVTVTSRTLELGQAAPPLKPEAVPDVTKCHTFSCLEAANGKVFLCAANSHQVMILEWSSKRGHFVLRNKFSTDRHTAAIHFSDHSVLVGTTKFYEIDLKNFSAEEFLDLGNPGIKETVASSQFSGSLPRSVMVGSGGKGDKEYLLAFTRHVLFVDSFGQQTRPPLAFEKLPLEHVLVGNVLATSFSDQVEFLDLEAKDEMRRVMLCSPHLLGTRGRELMISQQDTASNNVTGIMLGEERE